MIEILTPESRNKLIGKKRKFFRTNAQKLLRFAVNATGDKAPRCGNFPRCGDKQRNRYHRTHGSTHIKCPLITQGSEYLEKALEVRFM